MLNQWRLMMSTKIFDRDAISKAEQRAAIATAQLQVAESYYSKEYDKAQSELERLWKEPSDDTPSP
jgi:hypothetical protein